MRQLRVGSAVLVTFLPALALGAPGIRIDASADVQVTVVPPPIVIDATVQVGGSIGVDVDAAPLEGAEPAPFEVPRTSSVATAPSGPVDWGIDELVAAHWEASLGLAVATDLGSDAINPSASIGRQVGPVRIALDYAKYARELPPQQMALLTCPASTSRIGVAARYRISMAAGIGGIGAYVEAGLGREVSTFKDGTQQAATSAMAGLGVEALFGGHRSIGFDMGLRAYRDDRDNLVGLLQIGVLVGAR